MEHLTSTKSSPRAEHQLYHEYSVAEDQERTNVHYEQPPEFFYLFTGGEWNVYSGNLWDTATNDTESQEAKLDMTARLAGLKPGMRILDVGCGWAGPITYLTTKYDCEGVGLTLSPTQKKEAEARVARKSAKVEINLCHWQEYEPDAPFDAIVTDEVIVHFFDLAGFFQKCHEWLKPGGVMVNKELHHKHPRHEVLERGGEFISQIYGDTGNYRTLADELQMGYDAGFEMTVHHISAWHYETTIDHWQSNMYEHRERIKELLGDEGYKNWRIYLKLARRIQRNMTLDYVVGHKF